MLGEGKLFLSARLFVIFIHLLLFLLMLFVLRLRRFYILSSSSFNLIEFTLNSIQFLLCQML